MARLQKHQHNTYQYSPHTQACRQAVSWVTCLDHLLYIVSDMLEEACSHVWRAVNDEAHWKCSPASEPGHEGASVGRVCWNSKGSHELKGTLHAGLHPGHVSKEGIAPKCAGKQRVSCHGGNVHLPCRAQAVALRWWCRSRTGFMMPCARDTCSYPFAALSLAMAG